MTLLNKGIIATSTIGAIGGCVGAYVGGLFNSPKKEKTQKIIKTTISKQLEKEGFEVLNPDNSEGWNDVLVAYRGATTKTFSGRAENEKQEQELRNKCKEIISLESSVDYPKAKIWCVKKEKMNTILDRGGFKVLTSSGNIADGEQDAWNQKIKELVDLDIKSFEGLKEKIKKGDQYLTENVQALRAECEKIKIGELDTTNEKFETNFDLVKKWCSIPKVKAEA